MSKKIQTILIVSSFAHISQVPNQRIEFLRDDKGICVELSNEGENNTGMLSGNCSWENLPELRDFCAGNFHRHFSFKWKFLLKLMTVANTSSALASAEHRAERFMSINSFNPRNYLLRYVLLLDAFTDEGVEAQRG